MLEPWIVYFSQFWILVSFEKRPLQQIFYWTGNPVVGVFKSSPGTRGGFRQLSWLERVKWWVLIYVLCVFLIGTPQQNKGVELQSLKKDIVIHYIYCRATFSLLDPKCFSQLSGPRLEFMDGYLNWKRARLTRERLEVQVFYYPPQITIYQVVILLRRQLVLATNK